MNPYPESAVEQKLRVAMRGMSILDGVEMTEQNLSMFASMASAACLPKKTRLTSPQQVALYNSTRHLLGRRHTLLVLRKNMQRIIANWYFIMDGVPVPEWHGEQITADVVFLSVKRAQPRLGQRCLLVRTKLKTSIAAGIILWFPLLESTICHFLDSKSGCSKMNCAMEEISGMRARITFTAHNDVPRIQEWNATAVQKKANRELTEARTAVNKCEKMMPCEICRCTVSQCPLAVWAEEDNQ